MTATRALVVVAAGLFALATFACSDDGAELPSPTPTPDLPLIEIPVTEVPATTWLIEVETGARHVLVEDRTTFPYAAAFEVRDGVEVAVVRYADHERRFTLGGSEAPSTAPSTVCESGRGRVTIGGREYEAPSCGPVSPSGRWMFYTVTTGEAEVGVAGYRVPVYEAWVLDLEAGDTQLLERDLLHCGGCDGRWGPSWSPDGSRVVFTEIGGTARVFVANLEKGSSSLLFGPSSGNQLQMRPQWSPDGTLLLHPVTEDSAALTAVESGLSAGTTVAWPARFDATGDYVYTPAWVGRSKAPSEPLVTTVLDVRGGPPLATLAGAPGAGNPFVGSPPAVAVRRDEVFAALQDAPGCAGTMVYRGAFRNDGPTTCVERGAAGYISPDLRHAVILQLVGSTGQVTTPGVSATSLGRYDVAVVDLATGETRVVASGAVSSVEPPAIAWNEDGTHILVRWPVWSGL